MLFIKRKIHITKKICKNCKKDLKLDTDWYYANDNVFCSKICRKSYKYVYIYKKNYGSIYLGSICI